MFTVSRVDYFINGVFLGSIQHQPYEFSFTPEDVQNISETNELRTTAYDSVGNNSSASVTFSVTPGVFNPQNTSTTTSN